MRLFYLLSFVSLSFLSCNSNEKKTPLVIEPNETKEKISFDSVPYSNYNHHIINQDTENSILVTLLNSVYDSIFYIALEAKSEIDYETFSSIYDKSSLLYYFDNDSLSSLRILNKEIAEKYFDVDILDTLYLYNNKNVDTLFLESINILDLSIESSFIARYSPPKNKKDTPMVFSGVVNNLLPNSKALLHINQKGVQKLRKKPLKEGEDIFLSKFFIKEKDTFNIISHVDFTKSNSGNILVFRNNTLTDSIISEYSIVDILPTPFSNENQEVYLCTMQIPDTDAAECYLLCLLNTKTGKFYILKGNRINSHF
ncbi:MAG: hypothetical protein KDC91_03010 [Flavobacteriaceae bacterium]|nr:hypothetical protein [Flavobacteriaceae bacterium]